MSADPFPLPPGGRHLVPGALRDDLPFELRERQEDVQGQAAERTRRIELLRHGDEADEVPVENLDDPREIHQRPAEAVNLIDDHTVDCSGLDRRQKPFQRGALHVAARESAVVERLGDHLPALAFLTADIGFRRFPLRVQGVEFLLQPLLGRFPRVDGAPNNTIGGGCGPRAQCVSR